MDAILEQKIQSIIQSGFDTPSILKTVLKNELDLLAADQLGRDILGLVYMPSAFITNGLHDEQYAGAHLLLATTTGLISVEEGADSENRYLGGYRMKLFPYSKITCVEIDGSMLKGTFKVQLGNGPGTDLDIAFDTGEFFNDFMTIIAIIRRRMTAIERRLSQ